MQKKIAEDEVNASLHVSASEPLEHIHWNQDDLESLRALDDDDDDDDGAVGNETVCGHVLDDLLGDISFEKVGDLYRDMSLLSVGHSHDPEGGDNSAKTFPC